MNNNYIPEFKSDFKEELSDFIIYQRSNGYIYVKDTCDELKRLDRFFTSINSNQKIINQEVVDKWLCTCKNTNKAVTRARYFSLMAKFCKYLRTIGYENVIQPEPHNITYHSNFIPYIFSKEELSKMNEFLLNQISLNSFSNLTTFYILFNLYYCCGLRKMEALNLKISDFNSNEKTLLIKQSKNNKTRIIPLTNQLNDMLTNYIKIRNSNVEYIFVSEKNKKFNNQYVTTLYNRLLKDAEIPLTYDGKHQRLHDLRHTFCVHTLKQMEEKGFDLYTSLPTLSVYLGHKGIIETEYYLRLVKEENKHLTDKVRNYTTNIYGKKDKFYEE